ncbi:hypothetical protein DL93DRAFT_509949 [Clavulina sp. PMI_390]|nr:hypothetical protein DL93DRAFT_509949 [Clavulina sp. PMI_390]
MYFCGKSQKLRQATLNRAKQLYSPRSRQSTHSPARRLDTMSDEMASNEASTSSKPVQRRLTRDVAVQLEELYKTQPRPTTAECEKLAVKFDHPADKIKSWFANRRQRQRKQDKEREVASRAAPGPLTPEEEQRMKGKQTADGLGMRICQPWLTESLLERLQDVYSMDQEADAGSLADYIELCNIAGVDREKAEQFARWRTMPRTRALYGEEPMHTPTRGSAGPPATGSTSAPQTRHSSAQTPPPPTAGISPSREPPPLMMERRSHLPTPSSSSPSPRYIAVQLKNEPPSSPVSPQLHSPSFNIPHPPLPATGSPGGVGLFQPPATLPSHPKAPEMPTSPVVTPSTVPSPMTQQRSSIASPSLSPSTRFERMTITPSAPPSLREYMRSHYPTRAAFIRAVSGVGQGEQGGFERTIKLFERSGEDARKRLEKLRRLREGATDP